MRLPDFISLFLIIMLCLALSNDSIQSMNQRDQNLQLMYLKSFRAAVDDTGSKMTKLEAQQLVGPIKYGAEKQLATDQSIISYFIDNLSSKFGFFGDQYRMQELLSYIPVMIQVKYDSYSIITIDGEVGNNLTLQGEVLAPTVWPDRQYTYSLDNGSVVMFTMDDNVMLYDGSNRVFVRGTYDDIVAKYGVAVFGQLTTKQIFRDVKTRTITDLIQADMEAAVNKHLQVAKRSGMSVRFVMPASVGEQAVEGVGFMAYINGYPLPGGDLLTDFSFGKANVSLKSRLSGVQESNGELKAYGEACTIPQGAVLQEYLYDRVEAVKKGYYLIDCK